MINVVVVHPPDEDERGHLVSSQKEAFKDFSQHLCYQLATYFPYHSGGCGREASSNSSYARIGNCIRNELIPDDLDVFPEKVPDDLNRCLVKVGTVKSPPFVIEPNSSLSTYSPDSTSRILNMGIEMGIINTISEVANFELQVTMSYWQQQQEANSSTTSGLLKTLYDRQPTSQWAPFHPPSPNTRPTTLRCSTCRTYLRGSCQLERVCPIGSVFYWSLSRLCSWS